MTTIQPDQVWAEVREQYERYPYPEPEGDLTHYIKTRSCQGGCPSQHFDWYWPFGNKTQDLDILVAGCGTSQAPKFAINNPGARITAVDICRNSIENTKQLIQKHGIKNIDVIELPIENIGSLNQKFDLIISTGVLHHLPDPDIGLGVLHDVLRTDGSMFLMLYGKHGRDGVYNLQDMFRTLGVRAKTVQPEEIEAIRQLVKTLPHTHPLSAKLALFRNMDVPHAEIVDLFLHPQDRAYSISEIYQLVERSDLVMQKLVFRAHYLPQRSNLARSTFFGRIKQLPIEAQFEIGELYRAAILMHFFVVCRNDRPVDSYQINLDANNWKKTIPVRNPGVEFSTENLSQGVEQWLFWRAHQFPEIRFPLNRTQRIIFQKIDGNKTIHDIHQTLCKIIPMDVLQSCSRELFPALFDLDYVWFRGVLPAG